MPPDTSALTSFFDLWVDQFARALEMFTGERPGVAVASLAALPSVDTETTLWWKQPFASDTLGEFDTWVGAAEATWLALSQALGESDSDACRSTYLEVLSQAHHGTANALTEEPVRLFRCPAGEESPAPQSASLVLATAAITIGANHMGAKHVGANHALTLLLAIEANAAGVLKHLDPLHSQAELQDAQLSSGSLMMGRLRDVNLPISLALGSTHLSISEVLRVKPGSRLGLNKEAGDLVDLLIHGTVVARGEIVLVKENYGIRIRQIVSRTDRLALCPPID